MGCRFCVFWKGEEETETWYADNDKGLCRRFPQEVVTQANYYCGELKMERPRYVNMFYEQREKYWKMYLEADEQRKTLTKKLKEKNARLRRLKSVSNSRNE